MTIAYATVRGLVEGPTVLVLDLERGCLLERVCFEPPCAPPTDPNKSGAAGIAWLGTGELAIATYNAVLILGADLGLRDVVTHPLLSDVHGVARALVEEGFWVASTNLDMVIRFRGHDVVEAWRPPGAQGDLGLGDAGHVDLRHATKQDGYHRYHVNDVAEVDEGVLVTCLGRPDTGRISSRLQRGVLRRRAGRRPTRLAPTVSHGGLWVVERDGTSGGLVPSEGLHDLSADASGSLWSTQYFGHRLVAVDPRTGAMEPQTVEEPREVRESYLMRGVLPLGDGTWWVGYTLRRSVGAAPRGLLRHYSDVGRWTGDEIELPGVLGVYGLVQVPDPKL